MKDITDFRPVLSGGFYQAQIKCPECGGWVMTSNLEVHKTREPGDDSPDVLHAEAADVVCNAKPAGGVPCGEDIGNISLIGWKHRAPVKWREEVSA